ncbi:hypothetical protein SZ28_20145 [Burkholderia pseudomallei]|nr:hypothetical protein SZ28_20145 [Burkholderia pseudomallei]
MQKVRAIVKVETIWVGRRVVFGERQPLLDCVIDWIWKTGEFRNAVHVWLESFAYVLERPA